MGAPDRAIQSSHVFVFLITRASTERTGLYHDEIKFALKLAREDPEEAPTIVPLRLDDSERPANLKLYLSYDLSSSSTPPQGVRMRSIRPVMTVSRKRSLGWPGRPHATYFPYMGSRPEERGRRR